MAARPKLPLPEGWEYIRIGESPLHGRGLFAARDLPKGTHIMEYRGEKVGRKEGNRRTDEQWAQGRVYTFELNRRFDIDGSPEWNLARLANYSCDPNAESQNEQGRRIWIVATRDIRAGEEITYDYNFSFTEPPPPCQCGSPGCRGYIVGKAHVGELKAWLRREGLPLPPGLRPRKRPATRRRAPARARKPPTKRARRSTSQQAQSQRAGGRMRR